MTRNIRVRVPPPPGVTLIPEFITEEEEEQIIAELDAEAPWERLSKRRVAHFVSRFDYASRGADKGGAPAPPLPPRARAAVDRVLETATMTTKGCGEGGGKAQEEHGEGRNSSSSPSIDAIDDGATGPASADQITVNDYPPGSGIAPHVDTHSAFTARFASLSLGAGVAFELRRGGEAAELWLPRRSLLLLGGEARLGWAHYIAPRRGDSVARGVAGLDAEVARAVALAEEREREMEREREREAAEEEKRANGGGKGDGENAVSSSSAPASTTVAIPRRRRVSITIRQVREEEGSGGGGGAEGSFASFARFSSS